MPQFVKIAIILVLFSLQNTFFSQERNDSVPVKEEKKKVKILFAFDARRSFIFDRKTKFNGLKIGVTVKNKYRMGIGFYGMKKPFILPGLQVDQLKYPDASDVVLFNFNYTSFFYQPIWYTSKRWEISTPLQLGVGTVRLFYRDISGKKDVEYFKGGLPLTTFSGVFQYKLLRWFAIGTGIGYRMALISDKEVKQAINAPFYNFQFKLLIGEVYKMIFKRKDLEEW